MKKNKLSLFLAGMVATVSVMLVLVSILISSNAAGLDAVFSESRQPAQVPLYEMGKNSFYYTDNLGGISITDIEVKLDQKKMDCQITLKTVQVDATVEQIRYEIMDGQAVYSGTGCNSPDILAIASELGEHTFDFTVWADFKLNDGANRKTIRIYVDYVDGTDVKEVVYTATAEATF